MMPLSSQRAKAMLTTTLKAAMAESHETNAGRSRCSPGPAKVPTTHHMPAAPTSTPARHPSQSRSLRPWDQPVPAGRSSRGAWREDVMAEGWPFGSG